MSELKISKENIKLMASIFQVATEFSLSSNDFDCAVMFEAHVKWFEYTLYPDGYGGVKGSTHEYISVDSYSTNRDLKRELDGVMIFIVTEKEKSDERNSLDNISKTKEKRRLSDIKTLKDKLIKLEQGA